jgi:precorrin-4 methylase
MSEEKITVRVTETGNTMDVMVYSKRADRIEVMLGQGVHSVKCELTPTVNSMAYAGSAMGREIVYERSVKQVQEDVELAQHDYRDSRRR